MVLVFQLQIPKCFEENIKSMNNYFESEGFRENKLITELIINNVSSNELHNYVNNLLRSFENDDIRQKFDLIKRGEQDTSNIVCYNRSWIENYNFYFLNVKRTNDQNDEPIYKVIFFYYDQTLKPTFFGSCKAYLNFVSSPKFNYNQLKYYFFFKFAEYAKKFCPNIDVFFKEEIKHLDLKLN